MPQAQLVSIIYKTDYCDTPSSKKILSTDPLTSDQLPVLSAKGYIFIGWVHINEDGHESSLSERTVISKDWIINNIAGHYVIFTAKWRNDSKSNTATQYNIGDGLKLDVETNTLSVDSTNEAIKDNTQPITSAGVYTQIGNINTLLESI